jgi:hypothetical protein
MALARTLTVRLALLLLPLLSLLRLRLLLLLPPQIKATVATAAGVQSSRSAVSWGQG